MYTRICLISGLATLALTLGACDKKEEPTNPPTTGDGGSTEPTEEPGAPDVPWADKTPEQRMTYMGVFVLPKMKESFTGHSAENFKDFKCQTCHGDDMADTNYKMPNDGIYPLNAKDPVKAAMEYDADVTKFMMEQVVPQMSELLGKEPWSPENPTGFGCMSCHPTE